MEKTGYALGIRRLEKRYGTLRVLEDITLDIKPGEFVAVLGRSGCGKSTLLRLIAGLEPASGGAIEHPGGARQTDEIKFLFQESRLIPWRRVWQNISLVAQYPGRSFAREVLSRVGLSDRMDAWPGVLSGGQKQRVALARALSTEPRLLLLDEPLGALDALTRLEMQQLIEDLWLERGFTAVLVTHDVAEAVTLADRVVVMEGGRITADERIQLARRRQRNTDFTYYEQKILSKIMDTGAVGQAEYAI